MHVVWSSQLGAKQAHVASATRLMDDARVRHYWDGETVTGAAFQPYFPGLSAPAWDVWMLFPPGVRWEGAAPPEPTWWEHQLGSLQETHPDRRLDAERFSRRAHELAGTQGEAAASTVHSAQPPR